MIFVGGIRHSGTSLMQQLLFKGAGYNVSEHPSFPGMPSYSTAKIPEVWPPVDGKYVSTLRCSGRWIIYKRPTNKLSEVQTMANKLPTVYPRMILVWMRRDMPSQVWSTMARFEKNVSMLDDATAWASVRRWAQLYCQVNTAWEKLRQALPANLTWTIDLAQLQANATAVTSEILFREHSAHESGSESESGRRSVAKLDESSDVMKHGASGGGRRMQQEGMNHQKGAPERLSHSARRSWQMSQSVFSTAKTVYETEAPPSVRSALRRLARLNCTSEQLVLLAKRPAAKPRNSTATRPASASSTVFPILEFR